MAEDDDSRTEEPSGRKLAKAREEGNILQSQDIKTAAVLLGITVVVWLLAPPMMLKLKSYLTVFLESPHRIRVENEGELVTLAGDMAAHVGLIAAVPLLFLLVVGVVSSLAQTGWMISTKKLAPDLSKLNPLSGFGRMFSMQSVVELAKNIAKMLVVGSVGYMILMPRMKELEHLPAMDLTTILVYLHKILVRLLVAITLMVVVIGVADWFYQRYSYMKKMRMTKQEVKDEHKQTEGDPMIKSRLRALRMQRVRQRMMAAVPKADVVVTNPTHYACALKYDSEKMAAPVLVAKGQNLVALRIREIAEQNKVPVVENPPLARALYATVDIDREIPPEHYKAVAEVISYVLRLKGKLHR